MLTKKRTGPRTRQGARQRRRQHGQQVRGHRLLSTSAPAPPLRLPSPLLVPFSLSLSCSVIRTMSTRNARRGRQPPAQNSCLSLALSLLLWSVNYRLGRTRLCLESMCTVFRYPVLLPNHWSRVDSRQKRSENKTHANRRTATQTQQASVCYKKPSQKMRTSWQIFFCRLANLRAQAVFHLVTLCSPLDFDFTA